MEIKVPIEELRKRKLFVATPMYGGMCHGLFTRASNDKSLAFYARLNRQGLLEEIEQRQAQLSSLPGPQQDIANQLRAITQQLASVDLTTEQRQNLTPRKEELERELYQLLPELEPRIVEIEDVAQAIPNNAVLIEFQRYLYLDEDQYLAFVLKQNGDLTLIELGPAAPLEDAIQKALLITEQGLSGAEEAWQQVSDLVLTPLEEATQGSTTWFISPDAELNRVPFAALRSFDNNQFLAEAIDLRLLTTGRELIDLATQSTTTNQKSLVVANPNFDLNASSSLEISANASQQRSGDLSSLTWRALPGTEKEGVVISQLIDADLLVEGQATALAVQQQEAVKILHLASHAYYLEDQEEGENPLLRSGIVLAGANEPNASDLDDGYLTALEITKLDWDGTELVVISGCESGRGQIQSGEGVYGLKRAIAVAGSRSSLLSLWKVNDAATAAFMESFYKRLIAGEGRADALAATQKEFRNHPTNQDWRHPYVWAAFQLSGDWKPIAF